MGRNKAKGSMSGTTTAATMESGTTIKSTVTGSTYGQTVEGTKVEGLHEFFLLGYWKDNNTHGKGLYTWKDGRSYDGEYLNDKKHGFGIYTWYLNNK
jgi:hypothetical protein